MLRMFPSARITALDVSDVYLDTARKNLAGYDARFVKGEIEESARIAQAAGIKAQ